MRSIALCIVEGEKMTINPPLNPDRFFTIQRKAIVTPIVAAMLLATLLIWRIESLRSAAQWVDHTDKVIAQANLTERLLMDAETGIRGYYINRDEIFLEPYHQAQAQLPKALEELTHLVSDKDVQTKNIEGVREIINDWRELADQEVCASALMRTLISKP